MDKNLYLLIIGMLITAGTFAQTPAKKKMKTGDTVKAVVPQNIHSPIRTLTDNQYNAFLNGVDLNKRGYVSELNHFPLPDSLMKFKKELDLSPIQIKQIDEVVKFLQLKKKEIGQSIVRNERVLDSLFRIRKIDEGTIIFYGNRYGLYEGEYRTAVLLACYKTEKILTAKQIKKFEALQ